MSSYATLNRLSLIQIQSEERKQRAHLRKISEMQRFSSLDNGTPCRFPQLHQKFVKQMNDKRQEITRENEIKSKKLLNIMASKAVHPLTPFYPTNRNRRHLLLPLSRSNTEYLERIAKAKGKYNAREWNKEYEQHKEYLKISKDNKLFTPLEIGVNRRRIKGGSMNNSKHTTPVSSSLNMFHQLDKTN